MAIEWTPTINEIINIERREVRITCVRVDDDPATGSIRTYTATGKVKTGAQQLALMDAIWSLFQRELAWEAAVAPIISDLEADAKTNLEARE